MAAIKYWPYCGNWVCAQVRKLLSTAEGSYDSPRRRTAESKARIKDRIIRAKHLRHACSAGLLRHFTKTAHKSSPVRRFLYRNPRLRCGREARVPGCHSPAGLLRFPQQLFILYCDLCFFFVAIALFYPTTQIEQPQHPSAHFLLIKCTHTHTNPNIHTDTRARSPTLIKKRLST